MTPSHRKRGARRGVRRVGETAQRQDGAPGLDSSTRGRAEEDTVISGTDG